MIIIGIDPGTATTGFSIIESKYGQIKLIDYGCIQTSNKSSTAARLTEIAQDLEQIISKWRPDLASIEKLFFKKNVKTAISVAQARGVIIQKLTEKNIEINEYSPLEIKSAVCGYGKADKKMVQQMLKLILGLENVPKPDDAADAIAAGICLANSLAMIKATA